MPTPASCRALLAERPRQLLLGKVFVEARLASGKPCGKVQYVGQRVRIEADRATLFAMLDDAEYHAFELDGFSGPGIRESARAACVKIKRELGV